MIYTTPEGLTVCLIGDPHLGKDFDKHAPKARKGERATQQMAQFHNELRTEADMVVMVGDLFDHPNIPRLTLMLAASSVLDAAESNPDRQYVMMAGNHDLPRNLASVGAWTVFARMLQDRVPNLHILRWPTVIDKVAFFPWEWDRTAADQVFDLIGEEAHTAVGHWDLQLFDGNGDHLAPVNELMAIFGGDIEIYSGHFHTPGPYKIDGVTVNCTGSMQPISHGEDPDEIYYVTRDLDEVLANPDEYRDKHVRVRVKTGQEIPELDCLAVTHIRIQEETETGAVISPSDFDWTKRLSGRVSALAQPVQDFIVERMPDVDPSKHHGSGAQTAEESS